MIAHNRRILLLVGVAGFGGTLALATVAACGGATAVERPAGDGGTLSEVGAMQDVPDAGSDDQSLPMVDSWVQPTPIALSLGNARSCAVDGVGAVYCWGDNFKGELGFPNSVNATIDSAAKVVGVNSVHQVAVGIVTTCAALDDGSALCWGDGADGMMGNETTGKSPTPVPSPTAVSMLTDVVQVAVGVGHVCARRIGGNVSCWGTDADGEIGDGKTGTGNDKLVPFEVPRLAGVIDIAADWRHTCVVTSDGHVSCWGQEDPVDGGTFNALTPTVIPGVADATQVALGHDFGCALTTGGVYCWGDNTFGQLGRGNVGGTELPAALVTGLSNATLLAAGGNNACALVAGGQVACWGDNAKGELGQGDPGFGPAAGTQSIVMQLPAAKSVSVGESHVCAVTRTNRAFCWGDNSAGELGSGSIGTGLGRPLPVAWQ